MIRESKAIKTIAKALNVPTTSLLYWQRLGLVPPAQSKGKYREAEYDLGLFRKLVKAIHELQIADVKVSEMPEKFNEKKREVFLQVFRERELMQLFDSIVSPELRDHVIDTTLKGLYFPQEDEIKLKALSFIADELGGLCRGLFAANAFMAQKGHAELGLRPLQEMLLDCWKLEAEIQLERAKLSHAEAAEKEWQKQVDFRGEMLRKIKEIWAAFPSVSLKEI